MTETPPPLPDAKLERDFDAAPPLADVADTPVWRVTLAGALMGTANLVPGVSGGTMVLVCGLYAHFVNATAAVSRGRWRGSAGRFLLILFAAKFAAMGLLGAPVAEAVASHRRLAYSLFLGMTLAGTPVVWDILRSAPVRLPRWAAWGLIPVGFAGMAALALLDRPDGHGAGEEDYRPARNVPMDAVAGAAAYGAMVLPGVSGGTVKLALGRYEPTVWALGQPAKYLNPWDEAAPLAVWGPILLPYTLGAVAGLVVVSNLLKWLLKRYERSMAGLLLGVLWGSVVPIWPFGGGASARDMLLGAVAAAVGFAAVYGLTVWQKRAGHGPKPGPA